MELHVTKLDSGFDPEKAQIASQGFKGEVLLHDLLSSLIRYSLDEGNETPQSLAALQWIQEFQVREPSSSQLDILRIRYLPQLFDSYRAAVEDLSFPSFVEKQHTFVNWSPELHTQRRGLLLEFFGSRLIESFRGMTDPLEKSDDSKIFAGTPSLTDLPPFVNERMYNVLEAVLGQDKSPLSNSLSRDETELASRFNAFPGVSVEDLPDLLRSIEFSARDYQERSRDRSFDFGDAYFGFGLVALSKMRASDPNSDLSPLLTGIFTHFPKAWFEQEKRFTATYVNEKDLLELQLDPTLPLSSIVDKIRSLQIFHEVPSRLAALSFSLRLESDSSEFPSLPRQAQSLSQVSGARLSDFERVSVHASRALDDYRVTYFDCTPVRQFNERAEGSRILSELLSSGNYPTLLREMRTYSLLPNQILSMLREGKAASLVELEFFCRDLAWKRSNFDNFHLGLPDAPSIRASLMTYAQIDRFRGDQSRIRLCMGYQGTNTHTGTGVQHVQHVRSGDKTLSHFARDGDSTHDTLTRFLEDGVIHVAGSGGCIIPSGQLPKTHSVLTGTVREMEGKHVSLILAPSSANRAEEGDSGSSVVTAIFHENGQRVRKYLQRQVELQELSGHPSIPLWEVVETVNAYLIANSLDPLPLPPPMAEAFAIQTRRGTGDRIGSKFSQPASGEAEVMETFAVASSTMPDGDDDFDPGDSFFFSSEFASMLP
jgi:hypothetical protein